MRFFKPVVRIAFFALAASSAFAADGAIEINAACVADGCFDGDTPGFPVTAHLAGVSYILTSNLHINGAGPAIKLGKNSTLDLNGFSVSGPVSCEGDPAVTSCTGGSGSEHGIDGASGVVIKNGSVQGFGGYGISANFNSRITGVTVSHNAGGGIKGPVVVADSFVVSNGGDGISSSTAAGGTAKNSYIARNKGDGISITKGLVQGNRLEDNGGYGLDSFYSTKGTGYGNNQFSNNNAGSGNEVRGGFPIACNMVGVTVECPQ